MKTYVPVAAAITIIAAIMISSCSSGYRREEMAPAPPASAQDNGVSAEAYSDSLGSINSGKRKMVKTADLQAQVKDVLYTTTYLEKATQGLGGMVMESAMDNQIDQVIERRASPDSLEQIKAYTTRSNITLKVPVLQLDSLLSIVAAQAVFMDNRRLLLEDKSLQYLSNRLKQEASPAPIANRTVAAAKYSSEKKEQNIDRRVENLAIEDDVRYATIRLSLYQPQQVLSTRIADAANWSAPPFSSRLQYAFSQGWDLIKVLLLGMVHIWPVLLVALAGWILWRKYRRLLIKTAR